MSLFNLVITDIIRWQGNDKKLKLVPSRLIERIKYPYCSHSYRKHICFDGVHVNMSMDFDIYGFNKAVSWQRFDIDEMFINFNL